MINNLFVSKIKSTEISLLLATDWRVLIILSSSKKYRKNKRMHVVVVAAVAVKWFNGGGGGSARLNDNTLTSKRRLIQRRHTICNLKCPKNRFNEFSVLRKILSETEFAMKFERRFAIERAYRYSERSTGNHYVHHLRFFEIPSARNEIVGVDIRCALCQLNWLLF